MTPVIKGVLTDQGFANTVAAQQVFGGHGYIAEHGMEQFVRDARIAMLYEGANGIQALDLVGRKLPKDGGRALQAFFAEVAAYIKEHRFRCGHGALRDAARSGARRIAAGNHVVFAERAGQSRQCRGRGDRLYASLRSGCARLYVVFDRRSREGQGGGRRYGRADDGTIGHRALFMERLLPATTTHLARIKAGAASTMALPAEAF